MAVSQVELMERAKLAEQCERYEDMVTSLKKAVESMEEGKDLSAGQRNLFSVAYKNAVGARRAAWKILSPATESKDEHKAAVAIEYRGAVEEELMSVCNDVLVSRREGYDRPWREGRVGVVIPCPAPLSSTADTVGQPPHPSSREQWQCRVSSVLQQDEG